MPDYDSLQVVHTARRLYQQNSLVDGKEKQDLLRRFAVGYKILYNLTGDNPPPDWVELQEGIKSYRRELRELGLRDYQVPGLDRNRDNSDRQQERIRTGIRIVYRIAHLLVLLALSALPNIFLNVPVRIMADIWAERRRKKALARSKVKIHGYDVMLTEKLVFCIVVVPLLWLLYGLIMLFFTNFDGQTITLCFMCFPVFSYAAIISSEAGMVDGKDLKPYFLRLLPSTRRRLRALPKRRRELQRDLRAFVKKVGPAFGELYHGKSVDWTQITYELSKKSEAIMKKATSTDDFHHVETTKSLELKKDE
jgi:glycerol-3-phosphate O-acyltransferase/dihydroxyacetone phosphate acyltransferase